MRGPLARIQQSHEITHVNILYLMRPNRRIVPETMPSNDTKHVQTELAAEEYEQFRALAREHGLSLKEAGHDALVAWIDRQQQADPNDPAFTMLDELDTELPESAATDARAEDDLIEEWDGSDESFTLADDPAAESES